MRGRVPHLLFILCFLAAAASHADEGRLGKFEDKANTPSNPPSPSPGPSNVQVTCGDQDPSCQAPSSPDSWDAGTMSAMVMGGIFAAPIWLPHLAVSDDFSDDIRFSSYPFYNSAGYLDDNGDGGGHAWLVHADYTQQWVSDGILGYRGDISAQTASRIGLDLAYTHYEERLAGGRAYLNVFDAVPTYLFAKSEHWNWRAGLGYEELQGRDHNNRFKMSYRIAYFIKPFEFDSDWGVSLASSEPLYEIAPGIAYHWNRFDFKVGYRRLSISNQVIDGPEVSVGTWF